LYKFSKGSLKDVVTKFLKNPSKNTSTYNQGFLSDLKFLRDNKSITKHDIQPLIDSVEIALNPPSFKF